MSAQESAQPAETAQTVCFNAAGSPPCAHPPCACIEHPGLPHHDEQGRVLSSPPAGEG